MRKNELSSLMPQHNAPLDYNDENRYNFINDIIREVEKTQTPEKNKFTIGEDLYEEEGGQLSFLPDIPHNYFPTAADYAKIPNQIIERMGAISSLADLGMMLAVTRIEKRSRADYQDTAEGMWLQQVCERTGTDYTDGLIAKIPINQFIKLYGLSTGGRTYQEIDSLYNSTFLAAQWNIITKTNDYMAVTNVLTGTMYSKVDKCMYLKFNPDLEKTLTEYKNNFSRLSFPVLGKLKEDYMLDLYQILKKRYDIENNRNIKYGYGEKKEVKITINYNQLLFLLNIYPVDATSTNPDMVKIVELLKKEQYDAAAELELKTNQLDKYDYSKTKKLATLSAGKFREKILNKAFKAINGFPMIKGLDRIGHPSFDEAYASYLDACKDVYPTDLHFRYYFIKHGKGGKFEAVEFYISTTRKSNTPHEDIRSYTPQQKEMINEVTEKFLSEDITEGNIATLLEKADWNLSVIWDAYKAEKEYEKGGHSPQFMNYMVKAVEERWTPNKKE